MPEVRWKSKVREQEWGAKNEHRMLVFWPLTSDL